MTVILDGKLLAERITAKIRTEILKNSLKPKLAVIKVGDNPASLIYVRNKQKKALELGIESVVIELPSNVSEENILEQIYILNEDTEINAILVQLPLPEHINKQRVIEAIEPIKDVDGFTSYNFGRLALGYQPYSFPCTPKGIIRLLDEYNITLEGKKAVVIGRSNIVGKPLSILMQRRNATVIMAHSKTVNLKEHTLSADIVVSAAGHPYLITEDMINKGCIIVDVGINRIDNKLIGDIDFNTVKEKASYITPVPGGIGPMTIAMLMENTLELYKLQKSFEL